MKTGTKTKTARTPQTGLATTLSRGKTARPNGARDGGQQTQSIPGGFTPAQRRSLDAAHRKIAEGNAAIGKITGWTPPETMSA